MRRADDKRERARHQYRDQRQLREHKVGILFLELNEEIFSASEEEAAQAVLQLAASACGSLIQMTLNDVCHASGLVGLYAPRRVHSC